MSENMSDNSTPDNGADDATATGSFEGTLPASLTVPIFAKRAKVAERIVNLSALPAASLAYLVAYGLTQSLNDAKANGDSDDAESVIGLIDKRLDALIAGNPPRKGRGPGSGTTQEDIAEALALREAKAAALKAAIAKGDLAKKSKVSELPARYLARAEELAKANAPRFMAEAALELQRRALKASTVEGFAF